MSEVIRTKHIDIFGNEQVCVKASDYDRDTKALEDKARSQHARDSAELRDLCSQRDGFKAELWRVKEERDSQQRIAIAAMTELAELKAKMEGRQLVPIEPTAAQCFTAAFNLCNEFGDEFVRDNKQFALAAYRSLVAAAPSKDGV